MRTLSLAAKTISTKLPAFVMGIVNATPDSFWKESRGGADEAFRLIDEGADILDIGGESTRPGSSYVTAQEEIRRVVPVIEQIRKKSDITISVDTRKCEVMKAAYEAGADILNDISSLEDDKDCASFAAEKNIPVILMHKRGNPDIMQKNTAYEDVFREVDEYLSGRVRFALNSGIARDKIIIDPGIGFGKNKESNIALIRKCGLLCGGQYPVLMALSRKSCIGDITGEPVENRLYGTIAADLVAVQNGASIIRVHDVRVAVDSLAVFSALQN